MQQIEPKWFTVSSFIAVIYNDKFARTLRVPYIDW